MQPRIPLIAGNWKMHKNRQEAASFVTEFLAGWTARPDREVALCVPFTVLETVKREIGSHPLALGAQNLFWETEGAYTGEISASMLAEAGCRYVLAGHSERRSYFGETDAKVNLKLKSALAAGLIPICCVGENLEQREAGKAKVIVERQLKAALQNLDLSEPLVIAYEPVWAIGTGKNASSEDAEDMAEFIRESLRSLHPDGEKVRILYGGSVNEKNMPELMQQPDIDGVLVGGASLKAGVFLEIAGFNHGA